MSEEMTAFKSLNAFFSAKPEVRLVYLFGSRARGDATPSSDIDLAVLFSKSPSLDTHASLVVEVARRLGTDSLDLVVLNDASPLLRYDAVTEGKMVYQRISDDETNDFELQVIREYFDTERLRQVQDMYMREEFLGGTGGT